MAGKLKRFVKGSRAAKRYMAMLRRIKRGKLKKRKHTYRNGLYRRGRRRR